MLDLAYRRIWAAALLAAAAIALPAPALAAPRDFRLPAKPLATALVDFAVQADVSINAGAARACRRLSNAVAGRMEPTEALRRLLDGTGCGFEFIDARTVRIRPVTSGVAAPARAPTPPPDRPTSVQEVIVTATRWPSVAARLPYAVSSVAEERLRRDDVRDALDLTELTPGFAVTNLGPGRDKLIVRGLSDGPLTGRIQSTVGIYLDDTRLTYNAPDPDLRLVDIERVEILRGPQGSLYGVGSIGGVYHVVTRAPQPGVLEGGVAAGAAMTRDGDPSWSVEAVVNLPVFADRGAVRLVGWEERSGGYIDDAGLGAENVNGTVRRGFRVSGLTEILPGWSLRASGLSQTITSEDTQYAESGLAELTRENAVQEPHHNDFAGGSVSLAGEIPHARVRWTSAFLHHKLSSRYDASEVLPAFGAPLGPAAPFDERSASETFVTELNFASPLGARHPWLFGVFYSEGHEELQARLHDPGLLYVEQRADEVAEVAVYGEASFRRGPWTLIAGGRFFWASVDTESSVHMPGAGDRLFADSLTDSGFAPKYVARYQFTDRLMVYVQAAEGYRTAGFNTAGVIGQPFSSGPGGPQPRRRFGGDELWSYEAGGKWTNPDIGFSLQAAVFHVRWKDVQSTQLLASGLPYTATLGDAETFGLEAEAAWTVGPFDFHANVLLNEPELVSPAPGYPARPDSELAGVGRFAAAMSVHYERPLSAGVMLEADGRFAYVGRSRLTFDAATAPDMGDYGALRLKGGLRTKRWRASLYVENATDSEGDTFAYGNPFTIRLRDQHTPQRPLTAGVRLEWTY